jgi:lysyl-tRNA synthetase class II
MGFKRLNQLPKNERINTGMTRHNPRETMIENRGIYIPNDYTGGSTEPK